MSTYDNPFDWLNFGEGRARFVGSIRGWDEIGHEAFAVEVGGREYYGEIDQSREIGRASCRERV